MSKTKPIPTKRPQLVHEFLEARLPVNMVRLTSGRKIAVGYSRRVRICWFCHGPIRIGQLFTVTPGQRFAHACDQCADRGTR